MKNRNNEINEILFGKRGYEYFELDIEDGDFYPVDGDVVGEGRFRFFKHGTLTVEVDGKTMNVLASYRRAGDVILLSDLYQTVWCRSAVRAVINMLVDWRNGLLPIEEDFFNYDCILRFDGRVCCSDAAEPSLRKYTFEFGFTLCRSGYESHLMWLNIIHLLFSRDEDSIIDAGRNAIEWGELPHKVCPKCGRVTADSGASSFHAAVHTAAEELKLALLRDTNEGHAKKAKKGRKSAAKRLSNSR